MTIKPRPHTGPAPCAWIALFAAILALCRPAGVRAQAGQIVPLDPSKGVSQYVHARWDIEDGLPQNSVQAVLQTQDGYLWVATQEGAARFDGIHFLPYSRQNTPGLRSNDVRALLEDPSGALWMGTSGGGLSLLENGRVTTYTTAEGLPSNYVEELLRDRSGRLWVGTSRGLAYLQDGRFITLRPSGQAAGLDVVSLYQEGDGTLWVGTRAGLYRVRDGRMAPFEANDRLPSEWVYALREDAAGDLWIGTRAGLCRWRDGRLETFTTAQGLADDLVLSLLVDRAGTLWVGTLGGLSRLRDGRFDPFRTEDGLSHDIVVSLAEDREGNLWVGTDGGGLFRIRDGKFTPITTREGLSHDMVLSVYEDRSGAVWITTEGGGVNRLKDGRITFLTTADGLPGNSVNTVGETRDGSIWFGTTLAGVARLRDGRMQTYTAGHGLPSNSIYALYEDRGGRFWAGTDEGLARFEHDRFAPVAGLEGLWVRAILQDHRGDLWVGTESDGLYRLRGRRISRFGVDQNLGSDHVLSLYEDEEGVLWVGTLGGGLSRIEEDRVTTYTTRDGLFNDIVLQILEDEHGFFWMGSNRGVSRIARAELNDFAAGRRDTLLVEAFGKADGLKSAEINGGVQAAGWRGRDGRLWFSTTRGVATIRPARIRRNGVLPKVAIQQFIVNRRPVEQGDAIRLRPGSQNFEIHYAGLSFAAPERVRFRYLLEGLDEEWVEAGTRREAYYTNLPPRHYRFRVMASNDEGHWNEVGATLDFTVQPFFWQTGWFYLICGFSLLLLGATAYRLRVRQLQARQQELSELVDLRTRDLYDEKERLLEAKTLIERQAEQLLEVDRFKTRFFSNISHDFRTPLTLTIGPLENALAGRFGALSPALDGQLRLMLKNARLLLRLINQLLDLAKLESGNMRLQPQPANLVPFVEGIFSSFWALAEQKRITYRFEPSREELVLDFDPEKLEKVFYNLLSNAFKFSPEGSSIVVGIEEAPGALQEGVPAVRVTVSDTGPGIPEDQLPYIFDRFHQVPGQVSLVQPGTGIGLALVKEIAELHGGRVEVCSRADEGARFVVTLPAPTLVGAGVARPRAAWGDGIQSSPAFEPVLAGPEADVPEPEPAPGAETVLVVDDNDDIRAYVRACLAHRYRVVEASDGREGLEKATEIVPDLVVSDVMMPGMDGYEFCRRLKADPQLRAIPFILLTAKASDEMKVEGLGIGADDYLTKPFNARELIARVGNLIKLHQQERTLTRLNEHLEEEVRRQIETILSERRRYEDELIQARDRAEASARLKSSILTNMSHEIRTPITAILGFAQILSQEVGEEQREFAEYIEQNGKRLLDTLNSVLDLSRLESEGIELKLEPVDLCEAVRAMTAILDPIARSKGLALSAELPEGEIVASLDRRAVEGILANLLGNAIKFTDDGSVSVRLVRAGAEAVVEVRDTGVGIAEEFLPHLFEEFRQESSGLSRSHEGSGLGLAITKRLVSLLGGRIAVESRKRVGSTFTVHFPLRVAQEEETPISS